MSDRQTEKTGVTAAQLAQTLNVDESGVKCSGGQMQHFRHGWAVNIMSHGSRAHYFEREAVAYAVALCGTWAPVRWIYGAGNYQRCANCERASRGRGS